MVSQRGAVVASSCSPVRELASAEPVMYSGMRFGVQIVGAQGQQLRGSSDVAESASTPLVFGKRRRAQTQQRAAAKEEVVQLAQARLEAPKDTEEEAWLVVNRQGFAMKPPFHSWSSFAHELNRYSMKWSLGSVTQLCFQWRLMDHHYGVVAVQHEEADDGVNNVTQTTTGHAVLGSGLSAGHASGGGQEKQLLNYRSVAAKSQVVHLFLSTLEEFYYSNRKTAMVGFTNEDDVTKLLYFEVGLHPDTPQKVVQEVADKDAMCDPLAELLPHREWFIVRIGTEVSAQLGGTIEHPILEVSLHALTYYMVTSLIAFLHARDLSIPNYQMMTRAQMEVVKEVFDRLRFSARMHPHDWPFDMRLLKR